MGNISVVLNRYKIVDVFYEYFRDEGVWMDYDGGGYPPTVGVDIINAFLDDTEYTEVIERCDKMFKTEYMDKIIEEIKEYEKGR